MDNEILEEQRRVREEFLQLKKMQNGEIKPEPKPSEIAIKPKTFKEKLQNYWFHYKWHTIATVFSVVILAVLVAQCAGREKYDYTVVLFSYKSCLDAQTQKVEEYLENYSTDLDGDGKVNVSVINCRDLCERDVDDVILNCLEGCRYLVPVLEHDVSVI